MTLDSLINPGFASNRRHNNIKEIDDMTTRGQEQNSEKWICGNEINNRCMLEGEINERRRRRMKIRAIGLGEDDGLVGGDGFLDKE